MNVQFRPEVVADLASAADWYDDREAGLGDAFMDEYRRVLAMTINSPLSRPELHSGMRWRKFLRFPYLLWYRLSDDRLVVIGVLHARQDRSMLGDRR